MTPAATLSEPESARFGVRVARCPRFSAAEVPDLVAWCRENQVAVLMARCPASDAAAAHAMEAAGGRLMDTLVYWERDLERRPFRAEPGGLPVRPATAADRARLAEIARAGFTGYHGHYHADPRLDPDAATEGYVEWLTTLLDSAGPSSVVLVAELDGAPVGFGALAREDGRSNLVLNAVDPPAQRRGVYRGIVAEGLGWAAANGSASLVSSTSLVNLGVQRVWARMGFELTAAEQTFHLWT